MHTTGNSLKLWKTKSIPELKMAESKTIWTPPTSGDYSKDIWAPEIHFLEGKWYVYFTASDGKSGDHRRIWVLENASPDPMQGTWEIKGKLSDRLDQWEIDGSVFKHRGKLYLIWSGWDHVSKTEETQNIYIAQMKNPWTVASERTLLSKPELSWERHWDNTKGWKPPVPVYVNEGPQVLIHRKKLFIIYSASACWTNTYSLGMLSTSSKANLLDSRSWKKSQEPIFQQSVQNQVFGTGHNSFFKSPDGTEDWILYHANSSSDQGCGNTRSPRAQKITWKTDGTPFFGEPVSEKTALPFPSSGK
jgi:GH43 family beta-xylosidase